MQELLTQCQAEAVDDVSIMVFFAEKFLAPLGKNTLHLGSSNLVD